MKLLKFFGIYAIVVIQLCFVNIAFAEDPWAPADIAVNTTIAASIDIRK